MSKINLDDYEILYNDKTFLSFLKHQVQGVFNHIDCDHLPLESLGDVFCFQCIQEFIKSSSFKNYFISLYNWFQQCNTNSELINNNRFFQPKDIVNCFKSIHNYLTKEQVSYFCSSWLDGLFSVMDSIEPIIKVSENENTITDLIIFETLCLQGHLETSKWLYMYIKETFINNNPNQQQSLFNKLCELIPQENKNNNTHEVLLWLLSLRIFDKLNVNKGSAFIEVCKNGQLDVIELLLSLEGDRRIDVHAGNEEAFIMACIHGHLEVVRLLLSLKGDRRIDVHTDFEYALMSACENGQLEVVELLLSLEEDRKIDVHVNDEEAFITACENGQLEVVELLLSLEEDRRINVHANDEEAFITACENGHLEVVDLLLSLEEDRRINVNIDNESAFQYACVNEYLEVIKLLLSIEGDRRIDVHVNNNKVFMKACANGNLEVIELLLSLEGDRRIDIDIDNL